MLSREESWYQTELTAAIDVDCIDQIHIQVSGVDPAHLDLFLVASPVLKTTFCSVYFFPLVLKDY
jgi:hypothetical protein